MSVDLRTHEATSSLQRGYSLQGDLLSALRPIATCDTSSIDVVVRERNSLLACLQKMEELQQSMQRDTFKTETILRHTINKLNSQVKTLRRPRLLSRDQATSVCIPPACGLGCPDSAVAEVERLASIIRELVPMFAPGKYRDLLCSAEARLRRTVQLSDGPQGDYLASRAVHVTHRNIEFLDTALASEGFITCDRRNWERATALLGAPRFVSVTVGMCWNRPAAH